MDLNSYSKYRSGKGAASSASKKEKDAGLSNYSAYRANINSPEQKSIDTTRPTMQERIDMNRAKRQPQPQPVQTPPPAPVQGPTLALTRGQSPFQSPEYALAKRTINGSDVQSRLKMINDQREETLRQLNEQIRVDAVNMGPLAAARLQEQKNAILSKTYTPDDARRELMAEQGRARVLLDPQDEDGWLQYIANTKDQMELERYQVNPKYAQSLKTAEYSRLLDEQAREEEAKIKDTRTLGNILGDIGAGMKDSLNYGTRSTMAFLAGMGANTQELLNSTLGKLLGVDFLGNMPTREQNWNRSAQILQDQAQSKQDRTLGDSVRSFAYDAGGVVPDAVGTILLTYLTGGANVGAEAARAATLTGPMMKQGIGEMMKRTLIVAPEMVPMMAKITAQSYAQNKANGMSDTKAFLAAVVNSYGQSLLEGGGVNAAIKNPALDFGLSILDEGTEEVTQNWWERSINAIFENKPIPLVTFDANTEALVNVPEDLRSLGLGMVAAAGMAAPVGAVKAAGKIGQVINEKTKPQVTNPDLGSAIQQDAIEQIRYEADSAAFSEAQQMYDEAAATYDTQKQQYEAEAKNYKPNSLKITPEVMKQAQEIITAENEKRYTDAYIKWDEAVHSFDERDSTPESRAEYRKQIQPILEEYVAAEAARNTPVTPEAVVSQMKYGVAPKAVFDLVESAQKKPEAPKAPDLNKPTPPKGPQLSNLDPIVDTSKMAPAVRERMEADFAQAEDLAVTQKIVDLAMQAKTRSEIAQTLGIPPRMVRSVMSLKGIPDVKSAEFSRWLAVQTYAKYRGQTKAEAPKTEAPKTETTAKTEVESAQAEAATAETKAKTTEKLITPEEAQNRIDSLQTLAKAGVKAAENLTIGETYAQKLGKRLGADVVFFEGDKSMARGMFSSKESRTIFINRADANEADVVMDIMGHEFLHFINTNHSDLYSQLRDIIGDTMTSEKVKAQLEKYKADPEYQERLANNKELLIEEMMAEEAGSLFTDEKFWENLVNKDETLAQKLVKLVRDFINRVLGGVKKDSGNLDVMTELQIKEFQKKFEDVVAAVMKRTDTDTTNPAQSDGGLEKTLNVSPQGDSVAPKFSQRTWTEFRDTVVQQIVDRGIATKAKALKWAKSINNVMAIVQADPERLDYESNNSYTPLKKNDDPQYNTSLDFSTLCPKRYVLQGTLEEIQRALGKGLTAREWLAVRKRLKAAGEVVNCGLCYVESRRMFFGGVVNRYVEENLNQNEWYRPTEAKGDFPKNGKPPKELFLSQAGLDTLKVEYPDFYKDFNSRLGAETKSKLQESRTEYSRQILDHYDTPDKVIAQNLRSGQRLQSWSDFEAVHLIDLMQAVVDMSIVGLKAHSYTKVADFARAMGLTGMMVNVSLIAKGNGFDANGNLIFDSIEGMDFNEALALTKQFPKTVGTVAVAVSPEHLRALLAHPDIHYVIPYHASGLGVESRILSGESNALWTDFSDYQKETTKKAEYKYNAKGKKTLVKAPEIPFYAYWDEKKSPEANVKKYFELCEEAGVYPKFSGWSNKRKYNADFDFTKDPNYWKMLTDRRMFDDKVKAIVQQVVKPEFDEAVLQDILSRYAGGAQKLPVNQSVVDSILTDIRDGVPLDPYDKEMTKAQVKKIQKQLEQELFEKNAIRGFTTDELSDTLKTNFNVSEKEARLGAEALSDLQNGRREMDRSSNPGDDGVKRSTRARTIARDYTRRLLSKGSISIIGEQIRDYMDLAALAQVYRDPRFETFRVVFTKKNGFRNEEIIWHTGVTSQVPGMASVYAGDNKVQWIQDTFGKALNMGADGYYFIHNHPSGDPTPSKADKNVNLDFATHLRGLEYRGHVIVNSLRYSFMSPADVHTDGHTIYPLMGTKDKLHTPDKPHPVLGAQIGSPDDISRITKLLQNPVGYSTLVYLSPGMQVRGVQEIPSDIVSNKKKMEKYLAENALQFGGHRVVLIAEDSATFDNSFDLVESGHLFEALNLRNYKSAQELGVFPKVNPNDTWMGKEVKGEAVWENDEKYSARVESIEKAFKDSKIRNEDGSLKMVYHGTTASEEFSVFDPKKVSMGSVTNAFGGGFYFTDNPKIADEYAKTETSPGEYKRSPYGHIKPVFLNITHPAATDSLTMTKDQIAKIAEASTYEWGRNNATKFMKKTSGDFGKDYAVALLNGDFAGGPYGVAHSDVDVLVGLMQLFPGYKGQQGDYAKAITDATGIDGVIGKRNGINIYVALKSEQIKSPFSDNPVNLGDPDIRYAKNRPAPTGTPSVKVVLTEPAAPKDYKGWFSNLYRRIIDRNAPLEKVDERVGILASNAALVSGSVEYNLTEALTDINGKKLGASWKEVTKDFAENQDFWDYMAQRHNIDRARVDKPVDPNMSSAHSAAYVKNVEQTHPEYRAWGDSVTKWIDDFMKAWAVDPGIIDPDVYDEWRKMYPSYFPTFREFSDLEDGGNFGPGKRFVDLPSPVKRATGSDRDITNPIGNVMMMANKIIRTARYNEVGQALLESIRKDPAKMKKYAEEIPSRVGMFQHRKLDNVVTVWEGGHPSYLRINDKLLLESLQGLPKVINNAPTMRKITGIYKGLITQYNPLFALRNMFRDIPTAYVYGSQHNPLFFLGNLFKAGYEVVTGTGGAAQYRALGGAGSGLFSADEAAQYAKLLQPSATSVLKLPLKAIAWFNDLTEQAPRVAEFNHVLDKTGDIRKALYAAQNVTVNFARGGDITKQAEPFVPYLNASVQGLDKFFQAFNFYKDPRGAMLRLGKAGVIITAPQLISFLMSNWREEDREKYKDLDRRTKDAYYVFPKGDGTFWRIPKSRELSVLFGSLFERILTRDFKNFGNTIATNFSPVNPFENNIASAVVYNLPVNKDFAGRSIVPEYMRRDGRSPGLQYDDNTSEIAKAIGTRTNLSPKQIDYIIDSYTGIIGDFLLPATTKRQGAGNALNRMTIQSFVADPAFSSQSMTDFYDRLDELARAKTDKNLKEKIPAKFVTPEERMYTNMSKISTTVSDANKYINANLKADDPKVRQIRTTLNQHLRKAADAKTAADLVAIQTKLSVELYKLGVR